MRFIPHSPADVEHMLAATGRGDPSRLGLDESVNIYA